MENKLSLNKLLGILFIILVVGYFYIFQIIANIHARYDAAILIQKNPVQTSAIINVNRVGDEDYTQETKTYSFFDHYHKRHVRDLQHSLDARTLSHLNEVSIYYYQEDPSFNLLSTEYLNYQEQVDQLLQNTTYLTFGWPFMVLGLGILFYFVRVKKKQD